MWAFDRLKTSPAAVSCVIAHISIHFCQQFVSQPLVCLLNRLMWMSFCDMMAPLNMKLDRQRQFMRADVVITMICQELGIEEGSIGFQIHLDGAEVCRKLQ